MAHKSRLATFVIDCKAEQLDEAARFWEAALGRRFTMEPDGKYAVGDSPDREPTLLLQHVNHESRIHLDIETDDQEAERARLEALGAQVVERCAKGWIVMESPTGHRFCVVEPQRPDFQEGAHEWGGSA